MLLFFSTPLFFLIFLFLVHQEVCGSVIEEIWYQGRIPYEIDYEIQGSLRNDFQWAMQRLEHASCVKFTSRMPGEKFVHIRPGKCQDPKFDHGGVGVIITVENCHYYMRGYAEYLLARAIGFHVELAREDRDNYMFVDKDVDGCKDMNLTNIEKSDFAFKPIEFDYLSHLMRTSKCYKAKKPFGNSEFGTGSAPVPTLSVVDVEKMNSVYGCPGCNSYRFQNKEMMSSSLVPVVVGFDAGGDKTDLYLCRFYNNGSLIPGKLRYDFSICWIQVEDKEIEENTNFSIFVNPRKERRLIWANKTKEDIENDNWIPENAIVGGRSENRETLYIGRCYIELYGKLQLIVSKIQPSKKEFRVPYAGRVEDCSKEFQVLTCD